MFKIISILFFYTSIINCCYSSLIPHAVSHFRHPPNRVVDLNDSENFDMNFLRPIVKKINLKPVEQNLISKPVSEKVVQKPVNEIEIEKPVEANENLKPVNENVIQKPVKPNVIFKPVNEVIIQKPIEQKKMSKPNKELSGNSFTFPDNIIEDIKTSVKLFSDSINNLTNVFRTNALNSESANLDLLKILRFLPQEDVSSEKLSEVLNLLPQFRNKQMNIPKDMINILNNSADLFNNAITTFNDFLNANKIKKNNDINA